MRFKNLIPEDPQFKIFTDPNPGGNPNGEAIGGQGDDIKPKGDDGSTDPTLPKDPPPPSADVFQVELNGKTFLLNDKGDGRVAPVVTRFTGIKQPIDIEDAEKVNVVDGIASFVSR